MSEAGEHRPVDAARYRVTVDSRELVIDVTEGDGGLTVRVNEGQPRLATVRQARGDALYAFVADGRAFAALVDGREGEYTVVLDGQTMQVGVEDERAARLARASGGGQRAAADANVAAPMPGLVVAVNVEPGQRVFKGASLVVLQAMKMENDLTARADGTIKEVLVGPGQTVEQGQTLLTLE